MIKRGRSFLKSSIFMAGVMLLILAVVMGYFSIKSLLAALPVESYEDKGVYIFSPREVRSAQVKNTGASSRDRRLYPMKTVYMVCYQDTDGRGYQWTERAVTRDWGEAIVKEGVAVNRRVLRIPERGTYITVEPEETAQSHVAGERRRNLVTIGLSGAYCLFYLAAWKGVWALQRRRAGERMD